MPILAKVNPATTAGIVIYTAPAGRKPLVNVNIANVGAVNASFTLGLVQAPDVALASVAVATGGEYTSIPLVVVTGTNTTPATVAVDTLSAASATVASGGTGFAVNDVLTIAAGTSASKATVKVTSVNASGAILTADLTVGGVYTVLPTSPANVTGGGGTLASFVLTWKILTAVVTTKGNGYNSAATTFSTTGGGSSTAATFTAQYSVVFEVATDSYHPITAMLPSGVIERTGIALSAGDSIIAMSSIANAFNFIVLGYEDLA